MKFPGFFFPPTYNTLESSQKASFLHYTLIISAPTLLLFGILNLSWNAITLGWLLIGISGFCIAIIILNKSDQYYLAALLFSALIFIAIFYNLIDGAALHDPGIAALPVFLILTSVFFRKSTIPFFTLVSILGIIAIFFFWKTDILILSRPPTINRVIIICILQVVSGIFSWMIVSTQSDILGELDQSEKRFRSLFLAAPIGMGVTSLDGRVHLYNESLINMGGYTPDEFKLLNAQEYYANPEDRIEMLNILESAGVVRGYETQFLRKDRSIYSVNMSILPLKFDDGDALLTIIEDISKRKQTELVKQEEMEFRRLLVDASPIYFTVVNRQGQTTMMNKSMLGALGYEWEEIREVDYIKTFVPEREQSEFLKVIEGEFEHNKIPISENHILTKTGQELLVEWHASPIKNSEDKIEFIFAYGVDITERKEAEQYLIDSEYLLRESQKVAGLGSYSFDIPSGDWKSSQILDDLFGIDEKYTRDFANWAPIIHPVDRVMMQDYFSTNVLKDHEPFNKEYRIQRINDQQVRWVHGLGKLEFSDDGSPIKMIGTIQDITERKKAEKALKESAERHRVFFEDSPLLNWQYNLNPPMPINLPLEEQIDWILRKTILVDVNLEKSDLRGAADMALGLNLYKNWGENEEIGSKIARDFINQNYSLEKYETQETTILNNLVWSNIYAFGVIEDEHLTRIWGTTLDITERMHAEQAIKESHQLLATAETVANMGSWRWNLETNQVSYSDNALKLYGLSSDEYDGNMESVFSVFHPDDREIVQEEIQSMLTEKEPRHFEYRVVSPDGGYKVIEGTNKMYFDKAGNTTHLIGHIQDITDRKMAEEELKESEDKFQKVFMNSPYSMAIAGLKDGIIVDVNEEFEKQLGYSREEVIGRTVLDLGLVKDPNTIEKRNQIIAVEGSSRNLEMRLKHKDGREIIILVSTMIIELKGDPYRVSIGKDITDLRESELRYRMLFENASDAIFVLRDNRVIDCNSGIESMFGYTKEEAIGMHPGEISPHLQPDGRESISKAEALTRELSVDSPVLFEWVHQRKDGSEFTAEVKLHQIVVQDERLSLAVLRDTTERKLGEEAALEERQRLAHELHDAVSQTLFSASTIAQTLERTWDDNPDLVYQNLGELQILTQGALAEMRNLLLELRPEALEHIAMPDLLRQLVEGFSGRTKTEIELSILEDHPLSYNVRFVFFRLAQEALNNIIKHARANQVQVNYDSQPDQVQLTIEDDGRGFDPSIISPGRHGLEIMKERAEKINATIHIKSQVGDGTTVSINWRPREVPS